MTLYLDSDKTVWKFTWYYDTNETPCFLPQTTSLGNFLNESMFQQLQLYTENFRQVCLLRFQFAAAHLFINQSPTLCASARTVTGTYAHLDYSTEYLKDSGKQEFNLQC